MGNWHQWAATLGNKAGRAIDATLGRDEMSGVERRMKE